MKVRRILQPGQPRTKKLEERYGENLTCVRYRYNAEMNRKFKMIELVVENKPWQADARKIPKNKIMRIRISRDVVESRSRLKAAGGKWVPKRQVWQLAYQKVAELGLTDRIVDNEPF